MQTTEQQTQIKSKNKLVYLIGVIILILGTSMLSWHLLAQPAIQKPMDFVILGVPYIGVHNHTGRLSHIRGGTASAVASILEYWSPRGNDMRRIQERFRLEFRFDNLITKKEIEDIIRGHRGGYTSKIVQLEINELKKYINPELKTPLFLFLPLYKNQPLEVNYFSAMVLIGIKESEEKLIFHNTWLGNNYEITFEEFNKLQKRLKPEMRNSYLVIQPKNLKEKLEEISLRELIPYPDRTQVMLEAEDMIKNFVIGDTARRFGAYDIALNYFLKVVNNPKFDSWLPPYFKVMTLTRMAENYLSLMETENALYYVNKAISLNYDLHKPFKDWPGFEVRTNWPNIHIIDRISGPYRVLGDIYKELKEFEKAEKAYQNALNIGPRNFMALTNLELVRIELNK